MEIVLHRKNPNIPQCGQYCVAMVANTKPSYVVNRGRIYGGTTAWQLGKLLKQWHLYTSKKALKWKGENNITSNIAILGLDYLTGGQGHWVVYKDGIIYCSDEGVYPFSEEQYTKRGMKISQYLPILTPTP